MLCIFLYLSTVNYDVQMDEAQIQDQMLNNQKLNTAVMKNNVHCTIFFYYQTKHVYLDNWIYIVSQNDF